MLEHTSHSAPPCIPRWDTEEVRTYMSLHTCEHMLPNANACCYIIFDIQVDVENILWGSWYSSDHGRRGQTP